MVVLVELGDQAYAAAFSKEKPGLGWVIL